LQQQVDAEFDQQRAVARMTGLFGVLALILAAVGIYGVTAYSVERRTSEIGVRMALGADRSSVTRLVLRGAFLQVLVGLLIGIPIAIGCSRLIAAQLYQVKGWDPLVLAASIVALGISALLASIIPAQRAAAIDPVKALLAEESADAMCVRRAGISCSSLKPSQIPAPGRFAEEDGGQRAGPEENPEGKLALQKGWLAGRFAVGL